MTTRFDRAALLAALGRVRLVCRGPKPVAALKELGLRPDITVPEPNTWRDLLAALTPLEPLSALRVYVQEYGRSNEALLDGLRARAARVEPVPIYAWHLPDDTGPLERAVDMAIAGQADAVLFTSAQQLQHWFQVAGARRNALVDALQRRLVVASIGPVTSEALAEHGIPTDICPEHPKMGHLVRALIEQADAASARKRQDATPNRP